MVDYRVSNNECQYFLLFFVAMNKADKPTLQHKVASSDAQLSTIFDPIIDDAVETCSKKWMNRFLLLAFCGMT